MTTSHNDTQKRRLVDEIRGLLDPHLLRHDAIHILNKLTSKDLEKLSTALRQKLDKKVGE